MLLTLSGCLMQKKPEGPPPYMGPTLPMSEVVQKINQNNKAIPTLYASCYIEANIADPDKQRIRFVNTEGYLLVRKPRELLLRGRKDVAGTVFEIGSTPDRYWLTIYGDENKRWWGYYRNIGKAGVKGLPVRPDLVGEVLGIGDIDTNFLRAPVPTMQFNNDLHVYMLSWQGMLPDRWYTEKEIWYDMNTFRPVKVLLFDQNGRVILRANLDKHKPVRVPNVPQEQWPSIATNYSLFFPDSGSDMKLQLSEMSLTNERGHPRAGSIVFKEDLDVKEIQLDEDCKD